VHLPPVRPPFLFLFFRDPPSWDKLFSYSVDQCNQRNPSFIYPPYSIFFMFGFDWRGFDDTKPPPPPLPAAPIVRKFSSDTCSTPSLFETNRFSDPRGGQPSLELPSMVSEPTVYWRYYALCLKRLSLIVSQRETQRQTALGPSKMR